MLYIVGTPIGNAKDISYRAVASLFSSDLILAEDTRSARVLLDKARELFDVPERFQPKIISYNKVNEFEKIPQVLELLKQDKKISLISEAGMPTISDPGLSLIQTAIRETLPYTVIPGPSAVSTALVHSGFKARQWMFVGFLPKNTKQCTKFVKSLFDVEKAMKGVVFIAFESPKRIKKTIGLLEKHFSIVVGRELTKLYEEIMREDFEFLKQKGEMTIVFKRKK
ncbi:rRNA small subunit methyltransferase 1 [Candidatus Woesebacteria bacterium]|nr:rRNA small subunit methyltransferase 1 [Candidatus Woesebacteria bacterium]